MKRIFLLNFFSYFCYYSKSKDSKSSVNNFFMINFWNIHLKIFLFFSIIIFIKEQNKEKEQKKRTKEQKERKKEQKSYFF